MESRIFGASGRPPCVMELPVPVDTRPPRWLGALAVIAPEGERLTGRVWAL